jgi:site-specific recombinase XerD
MSKTTVPLQVSFASLVQQFFTEYLVNQRALSPCTIASYRDAMMLFLDFAHSHLQCHSFKKRTYSVKKTGKPLL